MASSVGSPVGSPVYQSNGSPVGTGFMNGGPPPIQVMWLEGVGSPTIVNDTYTSSATDAVVYDDTAASFDPASATGKVVAEFIIVEAGSTEDDFGAGWRNSSNLTTATQANTIGLTYSPALNWYGINMFTLGTTVKYFDDKTHAAPPVNDMVFTIALDHDANRIYAAVNGVWQTEGANGGDPSGGNGWEYNINSLTMHLSSFTQATGMSIKARNVVHIPSGYTPVT